MKTSSGLAQWTDQDRQRDSRPSVRRLTETQSASSAHAGDAGDSRCRYCAGAWHRPLHDGTLSRYEREKRGIPSSSLYRAFAIAVFLLGLGEAAHAQPVSAVASDFRNTDQVQYREDALAATATMFGQPQGNTSALTHLGNLTVMLSEAFSYGAETNLGQGYSTPSLDFGPDADISWTRKLQSIPIQLIARLNLNEDTYAGSKFDANDQRTVYARLVAKYYDPSDDQAWQPYIDLKNTEIFAPNVNDGNGTENNLAIGVEKDFNFDGSLDRLATAAHSSRDAVWTVSLKVYAQRRFDSWGVRSVALIAKPELDYLATDNLVFALEVKTTKRWFDGATIGNAMVLRQDVSVDPQLTISYNPPDWLFGGDRSLTRILGVPSIAFQAEFEHVSSNIAKNSANEWSIAPALSATWRF